MRLRHHVAIAYRSNRHNRPVDAFWDTRKTVVWAFNNKDQRTKNGDQNTYSTEEDKNLASRH